jgi:xanthine/uracil permease
VSSMLMVSGLSTLLHTSFGSRLPLVQGASFVYLAPALAIIFSPDFANLTKDVSDLPYMNHECLMLLSAVC